MDLGLTGVELQDLGSNEILSNLVHSLLLSYFSEKQIAALGQCSLAGRWLNKVEEL